MTPPDPAQGGEGVPCRSPSLPWSTTPTAPRRCGLNLLEDAFTDDAATIRGTHLHQRDYTPWGTCSPCTVWDLTWRSSSTATEGLNIEQVTGKAQRWAAWRSFSTATEPCLPAPDVPPPAAAPAHLARRRRVQARPRLTQPLETPAAHATAAIPPCPSCWASAQYKIRRCHSFRYGVTASSFTCNDPSTHQSAQYHTNEPNYHKQPTNSVPGRPLQLAPAFQPGTF